LSWPATARAELAEAMALDTLEAVQATSTVAGVVVVTSDRTIRAACQSIDVGTVDDPGLGLSAAIAAGVAYWRRRDVGAIAVLTADLPCLQPADLAAALARAAAAPAAFVPDLAGTGTTLLAAAEPAALQPRFGPGSADAHRRTGALPVGEDLTDLRLDIDTVEDLTRAESPPFVGWLGSRTRSLLSREAAAG
jgi:2-phospho-L-lactate guanylyltransferase